MHICMHFCVAQKHHMMLVNNNWFVHICNRSKNIWCELHSKITLHSEHSHMKIHTLAIILRRVCCLPSTLESPIMVHPIIAV